MDFKVAGTRDGITALQMDIRFRALLPYHVRGTGKAKKDVCTSQAMLKPCPKRDGIFNMRYASIR
jgi:polyribonucleotide nucleotidyltransferase